MQLTAEERKAELERIIELTKQGRLDILAIPFLVEEIALRDNALESACEQRNDCCPISETGYCGAYPEWCNAVFSDIDGDANLTCRIKESESSMECWKKYYMGEILCE